MSENSSWSRGGRHRPTGAAYSDDDERRPDERGYDNGSGYGQPGGYESGDYETGGYGTGYGDAGYPGSQGYAGGSWPGDGGGYGNGEYGRQDARDSGYGGAGYGVGGYGGREGYGESGSGYAPYDNGYAGHGQDQYGTESGYGHGAGSGYGQDYQSGHEYSSDYGNGTGYGNGAGYGNGQDYGSGSGYGSGYGDGSGYDRDPGYGGYGADRAEYGDADYDAAGYGTARYGDNGYGDNGYSDDGYQGQSYSWPGEYGASRPQRRALGPGAANDDSGSLSATNDYDDGAASGAGGAAGWAFRPDTGPLSSADYDLRDRRGASPLERDDSGTFRGPASRSSAQDDGFEQPGGLGSSLEDTGSIRWSAGPPSARPRAERHLEDALPGPAAAEPDGYADWHNDSSDDWHDEGDVGLLSRRFGRGGGDEPPGYGPPPVKVKGKKRRTGRGKVAFTIATGIVIFIVGIAGYAGFNYVHNFISNRYGDYSGNGYGTVTVDVKPGDALSQLGPLLLSKGVIKALRPYDSAAAAAQNASSLQPGLYKLHHHMNAALAVKLLLSPTARVADNFRVADGERASDIVTRLAKATNIPASQFKKLIDHPGQLGLPSWAAGSTAEGFLFPDTYSFQPHQSALKILQQMVNDFKQKTASLPADAQKVFTTPWHALIVASLIQAEAGSVQDMPKISRVIWNRLKIGMPLQFDSTVFYAMGKYGTHINQAQEHYNSLYNTYLHTGLPPGPIGSPNADALKYAVHPAKGNWLYFITDTRSKPYKTYFTNSLSQLQQWQQKFQG